MQYNSHNKKEYPPMHTVEHVLNQAADRKWHCGRSISAHIEREKSRMDFRLLREPSNREVDELEKEVNRILRQDLPITYTESTRKEAERLGVDLSRIPQNSSEKVRIVHVGNYDKCLCIGSHVRSTAECGHMQIYSHSYSQGRWRVRFKLTGEKKEYEEGQTGDTD